MSRSMESAELLHDDGAIVKKTLRSRGRSRQNGEEIFRADEIRDSLGVVEERGEASKVTVLLNMGVAWREGDVLDSETVVAEKGPVVVAHADTSESIASVARENDCLHSGAQRFDVRLLPIWSTRGVNLMRKW